MNDELDLTGFTVKALDGEVGKVDEATRDLVDIGYIVVNSGGLGFGKKVTVPCDSIKMIDDRDKLVELKLSREAVKNLPKFSPDAWSGSLQIGDTRSMPLTLYPYEAKVPEPR
jgi:hypothetical protein